jgi:hypothetical protein
MRAWAMVGAIGSGLHLLDFSEVWYDARFILLIN